MNQISAVAQGLLDLAKEMGAEYEGIKLKAEVKDFLTESDSKGKKSKKEEKTAPTLTPEDQAD